MLMSSDQHRRGIIRLNKAIKAQNKGAVQQLLALGVDPNCDLKATPLCLAVASGQDDVVQLLLDARADANGGDPCALLRAWTPTIVQNLISAGADVNLRQRNAWPLLFHCAMKNRVDIAAVLLRARANIAEVDLIGNTALHIAALHSALDVVELLIDNGANTQARCIHGMTPLHRARDHQVALRLLKGGADVDAQSSRGWTPLHLSLGRPQLVCLLLACGASVSLVDSEALSPLDRWIDEHYENETAALLLAAGAVSRRAIGAATANELAIAVAYAARSIARERVRLIRDRAFEICVALQNLRLPALVSLLLVDFACAPLSHCVPMHNVWDLCVAVKHFKEKSARSRVQK